MRTRKNAWQKLAPPTSGWVLEPCLYDLFFAGWLIALMVWLLPGAETARVSIIIILTYLVGISGFDHIIAGSTATFFLIVTKSISWGTYSWQFFLPTLLGNVLGGVSLVAALGHAQVVAGKGTRDEAGVGK